MKKLAFTILIILACMFFITETTWRCIQIKDNYYSKKGLIDMNNENDSITIRELGEQVLLGDSIAYKNLIELANSHTDYGPIDLPYSIIMANKYNSAEACYNVYFDFYYLCNYSIESLDEDTYDLIISFLKRGKDLGNKDCEDILEELNEK